MDTDRNGLEILDRAECLRLLAGSVLGRIAVTIGAIPVILPVNFLVDGERILIRTGEGTKLQAATRDAVVAFEVDDVEPFSHTGWSVCVTGRATELRDHDDVARVGTLPLAHWAPHGVEHVVAVSLDVVTGRRVSHPNAAQPVSERPD
jgi:nitroimidazol reductase NimA-like FMN-containing flavoprotein (pyridoxamine 5'-phosphate oxidase superfamily)